MRDFEKRKARNTIIILSCIVCASAILLAAVFGTLATKFYGDGKVAANTIDEIYAEIALLRNETETNNNEIVRCLRDIDYYVRPIPAMAKELLPNN